MGAGSLILRLLRLLRERWAWWLLPLLITLAITAALALSGPDPEPTMPQRYDLPTE